MSSERKETIRVLASVITAFCSLVLLPIAGWALLTVVRHDRQLAALESWRVEGAKYTAQLLQLHGETLAEHEDKLKDHDQRIRQLRERAQ